MEIPALRLTFDDDEKREILERVKACLDRGVLAQGPNVEEFERRFAEYVGCRHAVALSSGGSALEAAMTARGVESQEVLIPTNTFLATASAVLAAGGTVRLLDIEPMTMAPTPAMIEEAIGPRTVGVTIVHIGGIISRDLPEIRALCDRKGLWLFEDCAHAHGSMLNGWKAGRFGWGGAYSFFATKVMTSGEGGMFVTEDSALAERVRILRNYGKREDWVTTCIEVGKNWRLSEVAAAIGLVQLSRLEENLDKRAQVAALYDSLLEPMTELQRVMPQGRSSWYKYVVLLPPHVERARVREHMRGRGIALSGGVYDLPLHRQPLSDQFSWRGPLMGADEFCDRHICLPIYPSLQRAEIIHVAESLRSAVVFGNIRK